MSNDFTFRRSGIYRYRWQWWYPWAVTNWWKPYLFRGGDEWCNDSVGAVIPLLGCLVIFWRPSKRRTMPCAEEWQLMSAEDRADYAPCGRYHGGRINSSKHAHWETWPCTEASKWLESGMLEHIIASEDASQWRPANVLRRKNGVRGGDR